MWGIRFVNFLHENLGTQFLQGFDKLIVYKLVNELRKFYREYSINVGGGSLSQELQEKFRTQESYKLVQSMQNMSANIKGNYESLHGEHLKNYMMLTKLIDKKLLGNFLPRLQTIG